MKSRQLKKAISSAFSLLLAIIMIFSISVPHVFAQSNMFAGTGDLEVGENETVDLLRGVAAASPTGENLQVTVKNVICETNGNYQYDGSGVLNAGSGGSVYRIEYEAVSPANAEERYSTTRKITVLPSETPISEETPETFAEEITEVTSEEITETLPEGVTEEASEEVPETLQEEITEEALETLPEETTESVPEEVPEASPEDATETVPEEETQNSDTPELPEETTEEFTDGSTEETMEFDENVPFTLSDLEGMGYSVQMDGAKIPIKNFELECLPSEEGNLACNDLEFIEPIQEIEGGRIKDHVPYYVKNQNDQKHSYLKAHVKNVNVYYMGTLHIYNDQKEEDYIYYTTDKQITNKTVYAVLKEDEKIKLQYKHDSDYQVNYEIINKATGMEETIGGWTVDDVFGSDRAYSVRKGEELSVTVKIPRGYQAEVYYAEKNHHEDVLKGKIGDMMVFQRDGKKPNQIILKQGSPKEMTYETSFNLQGITDDVIIKLKFKKVETIQFDAYLWSQTDYAKGRIQVCPNEMPNEQNTKKTIVMPTDETGASFTWEWDGVTSKGGDHPMIDQGQGQQEFHTWELDQLEINDEMLLIPMISLNEVNETRVEKTVLDSGTEVTLSVTSKGGENAYQGRRHYKLEITNCYEDITISGGNMVGHRHKEYVIHEMLGVFKPGYFSATNFNGETSSWNEMHPDTKIAKVGFGGKNKWTDPFRFQRQTGFYKPEISFTTKEGVVLQKNGTVKLDPDGDKEKYILYLNRTDEGTANNQEIGTYEPVSYSDWKPSKDGYYYFRGTDEVEEFVGDRPEDAYKGVILVNIAAYPIRIGLDYQNGADETEVNAPKAENITNLPITQYGGEDGYNLLNNQRLLVSNQVPVDKTNQFVFDHWEVLETGWEQTDDKMWGYLTGNVKTDEEGKPYIAEKGQEYFLDVDLLKTMEHCFYMKADPESDHRNGNPFNDKPHKGAQTHALVTVRAVWRAYKEEPTIPYVVQYILADVKNGQIDTDTEQLIEERTHTVNKGAKLVTDLYQDGNKTLSTSIQSILQGENIAKKDYTEGGDVTWVVYEPKTTKVIESVDETNNIATIYLIRRNTKINVEKQWTSPEHKEQEVTVQLQRRKSEQNLWKTVENATLNEQNQWKHSFNPDAYYEIPSNKAGLSKTWKYRVVEVDANGKVIEDGQNITINNHNYQVGNRFDTEKQTWVITNTRLLDLTVSKVVKGKNGDRTKEFIFDIEAKNSDESALNGKYNYIESIKAGFESQSQKPEDGTLDFKNGKAQIKLKHGQQILIKNLPVNTQITVTEQNVKGYQTSYTVNEKHQATGKLTLVEDSMVDVVNEKSDIAATGITDSMGGIGAGLGVVVIAVLSFGGLALLRLKKGRKR